MSVARAKQLNKHFEDHLDALDQEEQEELKKSSSILLSSMMI